MLQWLSETFNDRLLDIFNSFKEVDRIVDANKCLHDLLHGDCGKSAIFGEDVSEVFSELSIEPRLFFALDFIDLGDIEIDANPFVSQIDDSDGVLSNVILGAGCEENGTASGLYVDDIVSRLPKFKDERKVFEAEVWEEQEVRHANVSFDVGFVDDLPVLGNQEGALCLECQDERARGILAS